MTTLLFKIEPHVVLLGAICIAVSKTSGLVTLFNLIS